MDCQSTLANLKTDLKNLEEELQMWKSMFFDPELQTLPHPKFKQEWYPMVQEWVSENFEEDSIERNRRLFKFTTGLEQIFFAKLKSLFRGTKYENEITPEHVGKLFTEGALDANQMNQAHDFGLQLQQIYVEKIIQLYDLQPSFFGLTQSEFCEIFGKCP